MTRELRRADPDDADAGEIAPQPIDVAGGEKAIVRARDPAGELLTAATLRVGFRLVRERRLGDLVRAQMHHLALRHVLHDFIKWTRLFHRRADDDGLAAGGIAGELHLREERAETVILILRPALERMIVALVAVEARGEEKVRGVLHRFRGIAQDLPIARGRVVLVRAGRGENLARELIVGRVRLDLLANPILEKFRAFAAEELRVHLEFVRPFVRPVIDEFRRADELVHDGVALLAQRPRVGEEGAHFLGAWRQAGEVQCDAAEEVRVGANLGRRDLHALPFRGDELVDAAPRLGLLPDKAGAIAHHGERGRRVVPFVAREQRGFAAAQRFHQPAAVGPGDIGVAAVHERFGGDIARPAIGEGGDDAHLLPRADLLHHRVAREDVDLLHARRLQVELRAVGDPRAKDFVIILAELRALAAFVRDAGGGFEEHQRILGRRDVEAAAREVVLERAHVVKRVVSAQRKLEAGFTILRAVTASGVAAELRHDRVHVADKIDRLPDLHPRDLDRHRRRLPRDLDAHGSRTIAQRPDLPERRDRGDAAVGLQLRDARHVRGFAGGQLCGDDQLRRFVIPAEHDLRRLHVEAHHLRTRGQSFGRWLLLSRCRKCDGDRGGVHCRTNGERKDEMLHVKMGGRRSHLVERAGRLALTSSNDFESLG